MITNVELRFESCKIHVGTLLLAYVKDRTRVTVSITPFSGEAGICWCGASSELFFRIGSLREMEK